MIPRRKMHHLKDNGGSSPQACRQVCDNGDKRTLTFHLVLSPRTTSYIDQDLALCHIPSFCFLSSGFFTVRHYNQVLHEYDDGQRDLYERERLSRVVCKTAGSYKGPTIPCQSSAKPARGALNADRSAIAKPHVQDAFRITKAIFVRQSG
jgi:hypothetical protein